MNSLIYGMRNLNNDSQQQKFQESEVLMSPQSQGQSVSTGIPYHTSTNIINVNIGDPAPLPPPPSPSSTVNRKKNSQTISGNAEIVHGKVRTRRTRSDRNREYERIRGKDPIPDSNSEYSTMIGSRGSATGDSNPPPSQYRDRTGLGFRRSPTPETVISYPVNHPAPCPSPVSALLSDKEHWNSNLIEIFWDTIPPHCSKINPSQKFPCFPKSASSSIVPLPFPLRFYQELPQATKKAFIFLRSRWKCSPPDLLPCDWPHAPLSGRTKHLYFFWTKAVF